MIQPIIAMPDRQREQVLRLIEHCRKLDGTELRVYPITKAQDDAFFAANPGANFESLQAFGLRTCALQMKGQPFVWLEPDSIPVKKGWLAQLSDEYGRHGMPYMLSSDSHPPHDCVGGIGVYGPDAHWQIPVHFDKSGWDRWMVHNLNHALSRTPLIQHSYGIYDRRGHAIPRRFYANPGSRAGQFYVRPETLIFHRDAHQDLIGTPRRALRFLHTGDLGDIIAALPIIRQFGGGDLVITDSLDKNARRMRDRFDIIEDLIGAQRYINRIVFEEKPAPVNYCFRDFRDIYSPNRTLTASQAMHLGLDYVKMHPWLDVRPATLTKGRVVVARSARYHNPAFPWARIIDHYGDRCLFVGAREEHAALCQYVRRNIEHVPTETLLPVAELIAGSDLFIGNQSSPCWIAMALGHPLIQETHMTQLDSIVRRENAQFVQNSIITLP